MNHPQPTVGWGFCYAASRHEPADPLDPAEQGMSTMPLSHWVTFGNTFLKMFPAPLILCDCELLVIGDIVVIGQIEAGDRSDLGEILSQKLSSLRRNDV